MSDTSVKSRGSSALATVVQWWRGFWFTPEPMTALGLVRIAFGVLAIAWTISLLPNMFQLLGPDGVQPEPQSMQYSWGLLHVWNSDAALWTVWAVLLAGSIALTVGWHSRFAALLVFLCILTVQRRDIYIFNSGDVLIRLEAMFLMLSPCGAALSLDRRRTAGSFWSAQVRAPWAIRLMQVLMSIIYLVTVHDKIVGATWNEGTAVSYALRLTDLTNFAAPLWVSTSPLLMNLATWGTLLVELALGVLVWNRKLRPWVLAAGVVMHLMILVSLAVAFFSFAIFILYIAFTPPEAAERFVDRVRSRSKRKSEPRRTDDPTSESMARHRRRATENPPAAEAVRTRREDEYTEPVRTGVSTARRD